MYSIERDGHYWQLQEAKAMFSEVVRSAGLEPQVITVHGKETVVILSMDSYRKLSSPKNDLVSFMEQSPLASLEMDFPLRQSEEIRKIDF